MQDWLEEEQHVFKGWDFSHLVGRWNSHATTWDYKSIIKEHLLSTDRLLDMGTGGGEFLLSLKHPYENTAVTEAWAPNIELCLKKLRPLGITVYPVENDSSIPISDNQFDIIINRHEAYDLSEVKRILKPNGIFITQQVGGMNCVDLKKRVGLKSVIEENFKLETECVKAKKIDFTIQYAEECFPELQFFDTGAFVFWAKTIEWSFPDFSVEKNLKHLHEMQKEIEKNGFISSKQHRFVFVAKSGL